MGILFRMDRNVTAEQAAALFRSVHWMSGDFPEELACALRGAAVLVTAWDKKRLVGLCEILTDGGMTAYLNYLLVHPDYQGRKIGKKLAELALSRLGGFRRIILLADHGKEPFYEQFGFRCDDHSQGMALLIRE